MAANVFLIVKRKKKKKIAHRLSWFTTMPVLLSAGFLTILWGASTKDLHSTSKEPQVSQELVVNPGSQASQWLELRSVSLLPHASPPPSKTSPSGRGLSTKHTPKLRQLLLQCVVHSMPATPHIFSFNLFNLPDQSVKQITDLHSSHAEAVLRSSYKLTSADL